MMQYSKRLIKFSMLAFAIGQLFSSNVRALTSGEKAPEFVLPSHSGESVQLSKFKGKLVYLDFWASWCPTCMNSLAWLNKLQARFADKGLQIVTVNLDENSEAAKQVLEKAQAKFIVGLDPNGTTPASYNVQAMPASYLIGADGKIIAIHNGLSEDEKHDIEESISHFLSS